jgi:hypothetical protein
MIRPRHTQDTAGVLRATSPLEKPNRPCCARLAAGMAVSLTLSALLGLAGATCADAVVRIESFTAQSTSTAAGAHADATTSFALKTLFTGVQPEPVGGAVNDVLVQLPAGLVGDASNFPRCPRALFDIAAIQAQGGGCPAGTQVGVATVTIGMELLGGVSTQTLGVFNIEPGPSEPAMLGIEGTVSSVGVLAPIFITASASRDYALTATASEIHETPLLAKLLGATVTLWGVPGAHERADGSSNWGPGQPAIHNAIAPEPASRWTPFMQNPTDCATVPMTTLSLDTYEEPEMFASTTASSPTPTNCAAVPFTPSLLLHAQTTRAGAPTGADIDLTVPQSNDPDAPGTAALQKAVVTLPAGVTLSPSAASGGLQACTDEQFGARSDAASDCPRASVIGSDEVESPLLPRSSSGVEGKLTGLVFLGRPLSTDPTSGQMFRVFQELQGFGLDVKLEGSVIADPGSGQLTATFANLPDLPFEKFRLHLRGGPNAVLVNPQTCGANTTTTRLYPFSNPSLPATPSTTFTTSYDGGGAPCPSSLPFAVSASLSSSTARAGAISPLSVTFARADENQPIGQITARLPAGLLANVSTVALCEASYASAGSCPASSRVGVVRATVGAGEDPLTVQGSVYLARGSNGYPFMLSVVVPAVAGPYDLGEVVVPVWLQISSDGSITALSGPLPSILDGIPLDIRAITISLDRPGFTFNPTSCSPLAMTGNATSLSGTLAPISAPFQASGCAGLPFAPSFSAATQGRASKASGASLTVRISGKLGEANIHAVHVVLPPQLPTRLTTLQHACAEAQFAANPAGCPPGSIVGTATAAAPALSTPLTGPAFLVSHGGAAFPDLEIILQAEGVTVTLDGRTDIKRGVTSSTFASLPDVPISEFALTLPEGRYSLLASYGTPCKSRLLMPTTITGESGTVVKQRTRIAVTGCVARRQSIKSSRRRSRATA